MCHALFIAATVDLPLIPPSAVPTFSVELLPERGTAVARHFPTGWRVRYAGSTSGCGCNFHGDGSAASRAALAAYLDALPATAQVALYDCWEGDEEEPVHEREAATAAAIAQRDDLLAERRLITITNS